MRSVLYRRSNNKEYVIVSLVIGTGLSRACDVYFLVRSQRGICPV